MKYLINFLKTIILLAIIYVYTFVIIGWANYNSIKEKEIFYIFWAGWASFHFGELVIALSVKKLLWRKFYRQKIKDKLAEDAADREVYYLTRKFNEISNE